MNIKNLTLEDIIYCVESICEDYGDFISTDSADEIFQQFCDKWNDCNEHYGSSSLFNNMNRIDAYFYHDIVKSIIVKCIKKNLVESEYSVTL